MFWLNTVAALATHTLHVTLPTHSRGYAPQHSPGKRWPYIGATLLVSLLLASCGNGSVVEAGCTVDADCSVRCERSEGDFPGGLCTESCRSNEDCPSDTVCYNRNGGVCVVLCSSQEQCAFFGAGYICKDKHDVEGQLQLVCLGD